MHRRKTRVKHRQANPDKPERRPQTGANQAQTDAAIHEKPLLTPLIQLVLCERRIQGTICYTAADYKAVINLMAAGHYDTTGWVDTVPPDRVVDQGLAELKAGRKKTLLVDPTP